MRAKPSNMKYTDLCIYIDKTIYERDEHNEPIALRELDDYEIDNVFTYLYHILYALSVKKKLLTNSKDYDDFSLRAAGILFTRLIDHDQDFKKTGIGKKPIKSILNYIKSCLVFMADDFRKDTYAQVLSAERDGKDKIDAAHEYLYENVRNQINSSMNINIKNVLFDMGFYIENNANASIFKKNPLNKEKLELSIYLSILNMITLEHRFDELAPNKRVMKITQQLDNRSEYIKSWDTKLLPKPLVELHIKKIFNDMSEDIKDIKNSNMLSDNTIEEILDSGFLTYGYQQGE